MAGDEDRRKLYSYHENSNLVLTSKRSRSARDEPTGEAQSLRDNLKGTKMGDKAVIERPKGIGGNTQPSEITRPKNAGKSSFFTKSSEFSDQSPLIESNSLDLAVYLPKSERTKLAYEALLYQISIDFLPNHSHRVVAAAASEVLEIISNSSISHQQQKSDLSDLFSLKTISNEMFMKLNGLVEKIDDFVPGAEAELSRFNQKTGGFGEDESKTMELEVDLDKMEEEQDQNDNFQDDSMSVDSKTSVVQNGVEEKQVMEKEEDISLAAKDIGAYWLQEQISTLSIDSSVLAETTSKVLVALNSSSLKAAENQVVQLIGVENFTLIQTLIENRFLIYYSTRYKQAANDQERLELKGEMMRNGSDDIWFQLTEDSGNYKSRKQRHSKKLMIKAKTDSNNEVNLKQVAHMVDRNTSQEKEIILPTNTTHKKEKGYEEVHVPAVKGEHAANEVLVRIEELPKYSRAAFKNIPSLNRIQSQVYPAAMVRYSGDESYNMLVCAPTGAGKTNVGLLTILNELFPYVDTNLEKVDIDALKKGLKIVYVAPMKALVQEVVENYSRKLSSYGISVRELSGDLSLTKKEITETQLIVATPEKLDVITRKNASRSLLDIANLVIFDEIHLLHNERGAVIESLVCRILMKSNEGQRTRILALSATLPNFKDVAEFLQVPTKGLFYFDNSFRPCPLQQIFIGVTEKKALKSLNTQNSICYEKTKLQLNLQKRNQILIFVHSRNDTYNTARMIIDKATEDGELGMFIDIDDEATKEILKNESERQDVNKRLKEVLKFGIGIHHAGLDRKDRNVVEGLFLDRNIRVLISTATLAWGVNLPANNVIIKGTQVYNIKAGGYTELSFLDILQMLGRAGRPQFDSFGTGIIITSHESLNTYLSLINEQFPIESKLIAELPNVLNAEIVKGTITNIDEAYEWLQLTYLSVRMHKNPEIYGVQHWNTQEPIENSIKNHQIRLIETALRVLSKAGLVEYARNGSILFTDLGRIASHYYLSVETIAIYAKELNKIYSDMDILKLFSLSSEFNNISVRAEEKMELKALSDFLPIPMSDSPDDKTFKVSCLLQCYISKHKLNSFSVKCDLIYIYMSAERIFRALFEVAIKAKRAIIARKCLDFGLMVSLRVWSCQLFLRELLIEQKRLATLLGAAVKPLPWQLIDKLERIGLRKEQYFALTKDEVIAMADNESNGRYLFRLIKCFPNFSISVNHLPIGKKTLRLEILIKPTFVYDEDVYGNKLVFWCFIEGTDGKQLLHIQRFSVSKAFMEQSDETEDSFIKLSADVFLDTEVLPRNLFIRVKSDKFCQSEVTKAVDLNNLIMVRGSAKLTQLAHLQPTSYLTLLSESAKSNLQQGTSTNASVLENKMKNFESLLSNTVTEASDISVKYAQKIVQKNGFLNPILNQVGRILLTESQNVLIAAPGISNKLQQIEFAILGSILHLASENQDIKALYSSFKGYIVVNGRFFGEILKSYLLQRFGSSTQWKIQTFFDSESISFSSNWNIGIILTDSFVSLFKNSQLRSVMNPKLVIFHDIYESIRSTASFEFILNYLNFDRDHCRKVILSSTIANRDDISVVTDCEKHFSFSSTHNRNAILVKPFNFLSNSEMINQYSFYLLNLLKGVVKEQILVFVSSFFQAKEMIKELIFDKNGLRTFDQSKLGQFGISLCHGSQSEAQNTSSFDKFITGVTGILFVTESLWSECIVNASIVVVCDDKGSIERVHSLLDNCFDVNGTGFVHVLTSTCNVENYERSLTQPPLLESQLTERFDKYILEISSKGYIEDKQECVQQVTQSFFYRRLMKNPNYYGLKSLNTDEVSEFISDLVEDGVKSLEENGCIEVVDNVVLKPTLLGTKSYVLDIEPETMAFISSCISSTAKYKSILEVLSCAVEFNNFVEYSEHDIGLFKKLSYDERCCRLKISQIEFSSVALRVNVLTQAYISQVQLPHHLKVQQTKVIKVIRRLLLGLQQVCLIKEYLKPCLITAELIQMLSTRSWKSDSELLQLPGIGIAHIDDLKKNGVSSMDQFFNMEDDLRQKVLAFDAKKLEQIANFCNNIPDLEAEILSINETSNTMKIKVTDSAFDEDSINQTGVVFYQIIVGDMKGENILGYSRIFLSKEENVFSISVNVPKAGGISVYVLCENYRGIDVMLEHSNRD